MVWNKSLPVIFWLENSTNHAYGTISKFCPYKKQFSISFLFSKLYRTLWISFFPPPFPSQNTYKRKQNENKVASSSKKGTITHRFYFTSVSINRLVLNTLLLYCLSWFFCKCGLTWSVIALSWFCCFTICWSCFSFCDCSWIFHHFLYKILKIRNWMKAWLHSCNYSLKAYQLKMKTVTK